MHHPHETARPCRGAGRAARTAAGLALIPALALAGAAPAAAHDELVRTSPGVDETVGTAPERVALTFSGDLIDGEGIQNLLQVRDAAGNQWQAEPGTVDGPGFSAPLCEGLPNGDYRVAYRVVYSDGHSEERAFGFAVDDPAAPAEGTAPDGCGVAAAPAASDASTPASAGSGAGTGEASEAPAEQGSAEAGESAEAGALPAWVWAVGVAGLVVLVAALILMGRRARALGHLDDGR